MGDGLDLNLPMTLGCLWAIFCTDLRPGPRVPGAALRGGAGPDRRGGAGERRATSTRSSATGRTGAAVGVGRLAPDDRLLRAARCARCGGSSRRSRSTGCASKPIVKITGEFYLQTVEGDPNYNIHRWLEAEGAEVYPGRHRGLDRLPAAARRCSSFEDYVGIERDARAQAGRGRAACSGCYRLDLSTACARALGDLPHETARPVRAAPARGALLPPAGSTAARATCWSARRSGRITTRRRT